MSATADKRHGYTVAGAPVPDVLSAGHHQAGEFVPRNMRQPDIGVMTHPAMPVAAAQPRGHDTQHHAVVIRYRVRYRLNRRWLLELLVNYGTHNPVFRSDKFLPGLYLAKI
jgi:hypothetical protein